MAADPSSIYFWSGGLLVVAVNLQDTQVAPATGLGLSMGLCRLWLLR
jgi:hypothetical protein